MRSIAGRYLRASGHGRPFSKRKGTGLLKPVPFQPVHYLPLSNDGCGRWGSFPLADVLRTASDGEESQHRRCRESEILHRTLPCHDLATYWPIAQQCRLVLKRHCGQFNQGIPSFSRCLAAARLRKRTGEARRGKGGGLSNATDGACSDCRFVVALLGWRRGHLWGEAMSPLRTVVAVVIAACVADCVLEGLGRGGMFWQAPRMTILGRRNRR